MSITTPSYVIRQREFTWLEYFLRRFFSAILSVGLGGALLTAFGPTLVYWYLTKTESGAAMMQQVVESTMEDILAWMDNPLFVFIFLGIWPLVAIFMLVKEISTLVYILISINLLPWVILAIVKRILMKKMVGELGLKIRKNGLAKFNIVAAKIILYPILLVLLLLITFYFQITSYPETLQFTIEEFAHVLENACRFLNGAILVYVILISLINSYMQSLYVPPKKSKIAGKLKRFLDTSALGRDIEEEEIQVTKVTEFYDDEDEDEMEEVEEVEEEDAEYETLGDEEEVEVPIEEEGENPLEEEMKTGE